MQGELPSHTVLQVAYVGSLGRHLPVRTEYNQLQPLSPGLNPYAPGQAVSADDCASISGTAASGYTGTVKATRCRNRRDPPRHRLRNLRRPVSSLLRHQRDHAQLEYRPVVVRRAPGWREPVLRDRRNLPTPTAIRSTTAPTARSRKSFMPTTRKAVSQAPLRRAPRDRTEPGLRFALLYEARAGAYLLGGWQISI